MAEIITDGYEAARTDILQLIPDQSGHADPNDEFIEATERFFEEADQLADQIITAGIERSPNVQDDRPASDDAEVAGGALDQSSAGVEGEQLVALVGDTLGVMNNALVAATGGTGSLADIPELDGPETLPESAEPVAPPTNYPPALMPTLQLLGPAEFADLRHDDSSPATPPDGSKVLDPVNPIEYIFAKTRKHVGESVVGVVAGGLLSALPTGQLEDAVQAILSGATDQQGSWLRRLISRAARSVAGWVERLIGAAGEFIGDALGKLANLLTGVDTYIGAVVDDTRILDYSQTTTFLSNRVVTEERGRVVMRSFDKRMWLLDHGAMAVGVIAGVTLAAPISGVVIGLLVAVLGVWLASDHLGAPYGALRGNPDWHRPDLGS